MSKKRVSIKPNPTVFASSPSGDLFVKVSAIMNPMIPMIDGLDIYFFHDDKKCAYMKVDAAIQWCEKEMQYERGNYELMIATLKRAQAQEATKTK